LSGSIRRYGTTATSASSSKSLARRVRSMGVRSVTLAGTEQACPRSCHGRRTGASSNLDRASLTSRSPPCHRRRHGAPQRRQGAPFLARPVLGRVTTNVMPQVIGSAAWPGALFVVRRE
jgi:hypothetical protein